MNTERAKRIAYHYFGERLKGIFRNEGGVIGVTHADNVFFVQTEGDLQRECRNWVKTWIAEGWEPTHPRLEWVGSSLCLFAGSHPTHVGALKQEGETFFFERVNPTSGKFAHTHLSSFVFDDSDLHDLLPTLLLDIPFLLPPPFFLSPSSRKITIQRQFDNWYRVEWLDHPHRLWQESGDDCWYLCDTARLAPRHCFEGRGEEMVGICKVIMEERGEVSFKRCKAVVGEGKVAFSRPRGNSGVVVPIDLAVAKEAAEAFLSTYQEEE